MYAQFSPASDRLQEIAVGCRKLVTRAWNPYRPELYYMRGPGPKWLAKHGGHVSVDSNQARPRDNF
jgi:hypothetical protein